MTEVQPHHKKSHQQHQNCQNCVRQKKQNQTWIKIYQRLQQVQKNTHRISNAVKEHKLSNQTNRSFYKSYEQNIISLPKVKKNYNSAAMENAGFEVAIGILEKESKSKLNEQNDRLKKILNQMRKQRWEQDSEQANSSHMNASYFSQRRNPNTNLEETSISLSNASTNLQQTEHELLTKHQKKHCQETKENSSTKSSSFNMGRAKNFDLSRYNDLNLWLYQNDKHSKLQEDLFAPKQATKQSITGKRQSQILPTINTKK